MHGHLNVKKGKCSLHAAKLRQEQTHNHNIYYLLLLHGNNGYANAHRYYVMPTLPNLF